MSLKKSSVETLFLELHEQIFKDQSSRDDLFRFAKIFEDTKALNMLLNMNMQNITLQMSNVEVGELTPEKIELIFNSYSSRMNFIRAIFFGYKLGRRDVELAMLEKYEAKNEEGEKEDGG